MDTQIKEKIDAIFAKRPGNMICLEMYGDQDYDGIATNRDWQDYISDISHEMKLEQAPKHFPIKNGILSNLGYEEGQEGDLNRDDICEIDNLAGIIRDVLPWEMEDFNGEVNQYWKGMVVVTNDYKVLRVTTDGGSMLYRSEIGDLSKMKSQEEEIEKLALIAIENAARTIEEKFKKVKSDEGKSKVFDITEKLQQSVSLRREGES
jgi:hypothetical protein